MDALSDFLTADLEEELALPGAEPKAPPTSFSGLMNLAEQTCKAIAENRANLAELQDRCARDVADLQEERRREEQEHMQRLARIDAGIESVRAFERKETEVWQRYIAAARGQLMELLA